MPRTRSSAPSGVGGASSDARSYPSFEYENVSSRRGLGVRELRSLGSRAAPQGL